MTPLRYEAINAILERAHRIDKNCELFGASTHRYQLVPPIDAASVRAVEERYHFTFPEDYFQFLTTIANGGAGPDYGIMSFADALQTRAYSDFQKAYGESLQVPFTPRHMRPEEVANYAFSQAAYEHTPERFFIYEKGEEAICHTDGFWLLGTHGCQWDFGLIVSGEYKGQVFDTDNEGAYLWLAPSFTVFYQAWLERINDTEDLQNELMKWRKLLAREK